MADENNGNTDDEKNSVEVPTENPIPEVEPKKRGRGRPPKNPDAVATEKIPNVSGASGGVKQRKKTTYDLGLLSKQLTGIHLMMAQMMGIPELQIAPQEGEALASGVIAVAEQYDLSIDGKTGAAIQLLATAAMIYAPRFMALKMRVSEAKKNNVTDITPKSPAN